MNTGSILPSAHHWHYLNFGEAPYVVSKIIIHKGLLGGRECNQDTTNTSLGCSILT